MLRELSRRAEEIASPRLHSCNEQDQTRGEFALCFLPLFVVIRKEMQTVLVILTTDESLTAGDYSRLSRSTHVEKVKLRQAKVEIRTKASN